LSSVAAALVLAARRGFCVAVDSAASSPDAVSTSGVSASAALADESTGSEAVGQHALQPAVEV